MIVGSLRELLLELESLSNWVAFVTGPTGSGKSTFVSNLQHKLIAWGIHPGKEVRKNPELKKAVLASINPTAPAATETFVRNYVEKKIREIRSKSPSSSIVVDGMPRTPAQVTWCTDLALKLEKTLIFVYMEAETVERKERLVYRGDAADFIAKRIESDDLVLPGVLTRIKQVVLGGKLGHFYHVNTGRKSDDGYSTLGSAADATGV